MQKRHIVIAVPITLILSALFAYGIHFGALTGQVPAPTGEQNLTIDPTPCDPLTAIQCNDGNDCTVDYCVLLGGIETCEYVPLPECETGGDLGTMAPSTDSGGDTGDLGTMAPSTDSGGDNGEIGSICPTDVKVCPNGSYVSRDPNNNCEFPACPPAGGIDTCYFCGIDVCSALHYDEPVSACPTGTFASQSECEDTCGIGITTNACDACGPELCDQCGSINEGCYAKFQSGVNVAECFASPPDNLWSLCCGGSDTGGGNGGSNTCQNSNDCVAQCDDACSLVDGSCVRMCTGMSCSDEGRCVDGYEECDPSQCATEPVCGNGVKEGAEECDNGDANSDTEPDACRTDCTVSRCGDNVLDSGELCDCGELDEPSYCATTNANTPYGDDTVVQCWGTSCNLAMYCGNGIRETENDEGCDDGNRTDGDGCSSTCQTEVACGNGTVDAGEQCDNGSKCFFSGASCNDCPAEQRAKGGCCGEEDWCVVNSDASLATGSFGDLYCGSDCQQYQLPYSICGDGAVDFYEDDSGNLIQEECDAGFTCANGALCSGEGAPCADGSTCTQRCTLGNECTKECTQPFCWNGVLECGEECEPRAFHGECAHDRSIRCEPPEFQKWSQKYNWGGYLPPVPECLETGTCQDGVCNNTAEICATDADCEVAHGCQLVSDDPSCTINCTKTVGDACATDEDCPGTNNCCTAEAGAKQCAPCGGLSLSSQSSASSLSNSLTQSSTSSVIEIAASSSSASSVVSSTTSTSTSDEADSNTSVSPPVANQSSSEQIGGFSSFSAIAFSNPSSSTNVSVAQSTTQSTSQSTSQRTSSPVRTSSSKSSLQPIIIVLSSSSASHGGEDDDDSGSNGGTDGDSSGDTGGIIATCTSDNDCPAGQCKNGTCTNPNLIASSKICGNGILEVGEECDDSNRRDNDGCNSSCLLEVGICGDGIVQKLLDEQCESATHDSNLPYQCIQCRFASSTCGNGTVDAGEECDDGPANSTSPDANCRPDCSVGRCGDGILDTNELCDDGNRLNGDGCSRDCKSSDTQVAADTQPEVIPFATAQPQTANQFTAFPFAPSNQVLPYQLPLAQLQPLVQSQGPAGETGPAAVAVIGAGAAGGWSWMRRRKK